MQTPHSDSNLSLSRRSLIASAVPAAAVVAAAPLAAYAGAVGAAGAGLSAEQLGYDSATGRYTLPDLPYAYDSLEPHIDEQTMRIHHGKHHAGYVRGLHNALAKLAEIRAGTGGDEAAIFAGDLFRMYAKYAEQRGWRVEILSASEGEHGGYKEVISLVDGRGAYSKLKFESGAHRVQRVPETESQGRIHTSACTVAVLPEVAEVEDIEINTADLRIDTYRASGAGGQHVNKTDSAVRITHLPTGTVVECQDERSQHKNRARAMSLLKARLIDAERDAQASEQAEQRRALVGSGDRSERIRTYNFPQGRVTDHRINLTLYKLAEIMEGDLNPVIEPLTQEYQADRLAALEAEDA